jgi:hypothetical protein
MKGESPTTGLRGRRDTQRGVGALIGAGPPLPAPGATVECSDLQGHLQRARAYKPNLDARGRRSGVRHWNPGLPKISVGHCRRCPPNEPFAGLEMLTAERP